MVWYMWCKVKISILAPEHAGGGGQQQKRCSRIIDEGAWHHTCYIRLVFLFASSPKRIDESDEMRGRSTFATGSDGGRGETQTKKTE